MKNCLTCKHEPDWDDIGYGNCKKLPDFMKDACIEKTLRGNLVFVCNDISEPNKVDNCTLWEPKQDKKKNPSNIDLLELGTNINFKKRPFIKDWPGAKGSGCKSPTGKITTIDDEDEMNGRR